MKWLRIFFSQEKRIPLGRWRNCGEYMDYEQFRRKEMQKKERHEIKDKFIDPANKHIPPPNKTTTSSTDYMIPFIID